MRLNVRSNGFDRVNLTLEEIASVVSQAEYKKLRVLKIGETYERKPFAGMSGTYEFKATRVQ